VILGTVLVVGGANALNMVLERDSDARMRRTMNRPLPTGRLQPRTAAAFGACIGVAALPLLAWGANVLTALLAAAALVSYVLIYTPMKKRSPVALFVGCVPGAIPPLMGWTAATGNLEAPGLLLFAIMFVWQIPHFLAITLFSSDDFARGGIRVLPLAWGTASAKRHIVVFAGALVPVSLALVPLHAAGTAYLVVALVAGVAFFAWALAGLRREAREAWARSLFLASLAYIAVLFAVLLAGHLSRHA
jgi:protoheme IX farnesyltransferase